MRSVTVEAPAKVNLRLVVLARETTGFHSLETIFCGISLADRLTVEPAGPGIDFRVVGAFDTGPDEQNLVVRAARCFYDALGQDPAIRLRLEKKIPAAAGLGGGSSDAAATLRALNALFHQPFERAALLDCAANLGSDVSFFLAPFPFALAWGRGERLLATRPPPSRAILVAHPGVDLPTPVAFARFAELADGELRPRPLALDCPDLACWEFLESAAHNDLEVVARERIPRFDDARAIMARAGARICLLSGSGSSVFGVFPPDALLAPAERELGAIGFSTAHARTLGAWPTVTRKQ